MSMLATSNFSKSEAATYLMMTNVTQYNWFHKHRYLVRKWNKSLKHFFRCHSFDQYLLHHVTLKKAPCMSKPIFYDDFSMTYFCHGDYILKWEKHHHSEMHFAFASVYFTKPTTFVFFFLKCFSINYYGFINMWDIGGRYDRKVIFI